MNNQENQIVDKTSALSENGRNYHRSKKPQPARIGSFTAVDNI
jgi:hypothetical protein